MASNYLMVAYNVLHWFKVHLEVNKCEFRRRCEDVHSSWEYALYIFYLICNNTVVSFCLFEITDADTSLAEAAVLAQHEQQYTEERRDEEKRSRQSSTSSAASHASSTSSKASSTKGYPPKEDVDDGEGRQQQHTYTNKM